MSLSNEQKTTSALSSPSERPLQQIITREWIDGSNVERCGEAFLSSQETDIVHLDFAEELYSAVLDTATETWRLLSARQLVGRREVRAFKENLGRLYLVSVVQISRDQVINYFKDLCLYVMGDESLAACKDSTLASKSRLSRNTILDSKQLRYTCLRMERIGAC